MKPFLGIVLTGGLLAGLLVAAGCASTEPTADKQTHAYTEGMMCPNCETVWVTNRRSLGARDVTRLSYSRQMTCPDCDAMAQSQLLADGKVQLHDCPTCKVTPKPIKPADDSKPRRPVKGTHP